MSDRTNEAPGTLAPTGAEAPDRRQTERDATSDRRAGKRVATIKTSHIIYNNANCIMNCMVMDLSHTGARIQPADPYNCPDEFTLRFNDDQKRRCTAMWRKGAVIGVKFVD